MNNFDSILESDDVMVVIAGNAEMGSKQLGAAADSRNPSGARRTPSRPCNCTSQDAGSDDDVKYENPWDRITKTQTQNNLKCKDIFMGNVDCNLNVPCCCSLRPKTPQSQSDSRKAKSSKKKASKKRALCLNTTAESMQFSLKTPHRKLCIQNSLTSTVSGACNSCAKSRQYIDYLAKTLESFRQMNACGPGPSEKVRPKRSKTRARKRCKPAAPRCCCPPPCSQPDNTHINCVGEPDTVPKNMGWNWKAGAAAERKGWRPGAIPRSIRELMCHFLKPCPCDTLPTSGSPAQRNCAQPMELPPCAQCPQPPAAPLVQRPMITVHRKNDEYQITMNPLKSSQQLKSEADPYMNCEPVQFRIGASRREDQRIAQIKQVIRDSGFRRCHCGRPVAQCCCRDNRELEALRECIENCGRQFGVADLGERLSLNRLRDLELEFTPPAAVVKCGLPPACSAQPQETQYNESDTKEAKGGGGKAAGKAGGKEGDGADGKAEAKGGDKEDGKKGRRKKSVAK